MKFKTQNSRLRQCFHLRPSGFGGQVGGQVKCKIIISLCIMSGLILPEFGLAQEQFGAAVPQTVGEAKDFAMSILLKLPEAVGRVWREEAMPLWQKMWEWVKPVIEPWWQKFLGLLGKEVEKRRPDIEKQFQEEKKEMQKDLWESFKELLKRSI